MKVTKIITSIGITVTYEPINIKKTFTNIDGGIYVFIDLEDIKEKTDIVVKWYDAKHKELISLVFELSGKQSADTIINYTNYESFKGLDPDDFGLWSIEVWHHDQIIGRNEFIVKNVSFTYSPGSVLK